jgi:hypothetical protein
MRSMTSSSGLRRSRTCTPTPRTTRATNGGRHHSVEITFTTVVWVSSADLFHHPIFRVPTPAEREFARQVATDKGHHLFAWDAETAIGTVPMMVVAHAVEVVEGIVRH